MIVLTLLSLFSEIKRFYSYSYSLRSAFTASLLPNKNKTVRVTDVNSEKYAALKATFKQYRETLRSSIKEAKRLYYHRTFLLYQNNVRKTWSVIKETLQRKKKHEIPNEFVWINRAITDMNEIAN